MPALLGIDIGTTGAKALLIDERGSVLATAAAAYGFATPGPGRAEQDPDDWWAATRTAIRQLLEHSAIAPARIAAVGLTGQMHGLIALGPRMRPVRPCIMWNDQRAIAECAAIERRIGREAIINIAGKPALPNFTAPKLLWLRAHEPQSYAATQHLVLTKDYVRLLLTGDLATDVNDASGTLLFDVGARTWSDTLIDALTVPRGWLPPVHESPAIVSAVSTSAARETGLIAGTPVIAGCGDQAADAVGLGVIDNEQTAITIGSSGVVFTSFDSYRTYATGTLHAYAHARPGAWHLMGVMLSAGASLRWFRDVGAAGETYETIAREAAQAPPGCEGLFFLPYLAGERTPHADPAARGAFVGLTLRHGRSHMIRAVLEGVTFGLLDGVRLVRDLGIRAPSLRVSGGGVRSALWRQILADTLGAEIVTLNVTEGAAFGAALLAGVGAGVFDDVAHAVRAAIRETSRTHLDPTAASACAMRGGAWRALYPALADSMHDLAAFATP